MRRIKKVLVVYKRSFWDLYKQRDDLARLPKNIFERIKRSDQENTLTCREVADTLALHGIRFDLVEKTKIPSTDRYDLVIAVGGDGTLFATSHYVKETPVLSVNSDTRNSLALFSSTDRTNFRNILQRLLMGRLRRVRLNRLLVRVNGKLLREIVLNDILFAHTNPAAMSRYLIKIANWQEEQHSSGIWISTASGSTGGILAAGGKVMPIASKKIQYLVREPYNWNKPPYRLLRGFVEKITLVTLMDSSALYIDGAHLRYELKLGDKIEIDSTACPLNLLGYTPKKRKGFYNKS
jgi:NAD+ kinase